MTTKIRQPLKKRTATIQAVLNVTGSLIIVLSLLLLTPIIVALATGESEAIGWFALTAGIAAVVGAALRYLFKPDALHYRQGLLVCGIAWIALCIFAALPFVFLAGLSFLDAYFEAVSGFTTTGITVIQQ